MTVCGDLCTAEKCQELEARLAILEEKVLDLEVKTDALQTEVDELEIQLTDHLEKPTSLAHPYDIQLFLELSYFEGNVLEIYGDLFTEEVAEGADGGYTILTSNYYSTYLPLVEYWQFEQHLDLSIPEAHLYSPNIAVTVESDPLNDGVVNLFVEIDGFSDSAELLIPSRATDQINEWLANLDFFFRIDDLPNNDYDFVIQLGDRVRSQILDLAASSGGGGGGSGEPIELPPTTVSISGSYDAQNNNLNTSITVNGASAVATINLDEMPFVTQNDFQIHLNQDIPEAHNYIWAKTLSIDGSYDAENNNLDLTVTLNEESTAVSINLDNMPFEQIQNTVEEILAALTLSLSGQYEVGATDTTLTDEQGNKTIGYSRYMTLSEGQDGFIDTSYTGNGLLGLHEGLLALDKKITTVHKDLSKAIDPEMSLEVWHPKRCYDYINRDDYTDEEWNALPPEVRAEVEKDLGDRFRDFVNNNPVLSEVAEPLLRSLSSLAFKIPSIPAFFATNFMANLALHQLDADNQPACPWLNEKEIETVTIVASPEVQANIKDSALILDFTTVDAFPGLNSTKSKWRVQIPAPIENITWDTLKALRWFRGGQYGKIKFQGRQNYTAGWFRNKTDGENYFNQIANLTTLEVENIKFIDQSNSKISPQEIETRVYRAFQVFLGANGEPNNALTQVFKPPVET